MYKKPNFIDKYLPFKKPGMPYDIFTDHMRIVEETEVIETTIREWIAALRSGKYRQGQKALLDNGKFCCLGVLCEILDPTKWKQSGPVSGICGYGGSTTYPPLEILRKVVILKDPFVYPVIAKTFATLNDGWGYTFDEIAGILEARLSK